MKERFDNLLDPTDPGHLRAAERLVYAPGVLLDAEDLLAEQSYHRGRLARVLAHALGDGTLAGLRVEHQAQTVEREERVLIHPGLAIDRLGRLLELPNPLCLRLGRWFDGQSSEALEASRVAAPADSIICDVFLHFCACERGATPAFAAGPFDATDAHVPSRLLDSAHAELVLRTEDDPALPEPAFASIDPAANEAQRRQQAHQAILDGWREGPGFVDENGLLPGPEHPPGVPPDAVWIARISQPASAGAPGEAPAREGEPTINNESRRFVYPPAALPRLL